MTVTIIGGGLAGSEAAWQVASRGIPVRLLEMRPVKMTKAHRSGFFAELVCSNSFRGADLSNAVGLLKEELRVLGSLVLEVADTVRVPAGGALAVDRVLFSQAIDHRLRHHPLIQVEIAEVSSVPPASAEKPVIIASGPLTSLALTSSIRALTGDCGLAFFDAISPIVLGSSIDHSKVFKQSRYDKGCGADYLNVPLSREDYYRFVEEVKAGEKFGGHEDVESDFIADLRPFEGCMPIEEMALRGPDTLLFGPLKPTGLTDPATGKRPHAVLQLRQDNHEGTLWNMVGMQTRLKHPEQVRIFRSLPGLEQAEFVRLGSVHRNTFLNAPRFLNSTLEFRTIPGLFFAGQITGVEGYVESTAGGLVAGINAVCSLTGRSLLSFPTQTAIGSLMAYISDPERKHFQPMNISFGLMPEYTSTQTGQKKKGQSKKDRRVAASNSALVILRKFADEMPKRNLSSDTIAVDV